MIDRIDIYLYTYLEINKDEFISARMSFFVPETTNLKNSFVDRDGAIVNPNPVMADAYGRFPKIFIEKPYKAVIHDKRGRHVFEDSYE